MENQMQVKSRQRVADHGEVFTNIREVNAMLDLVKQETERKFRKNCETDMLESTINHSFRLQPVLISSLWGNSERLHPRHLRELCFSSIDRRKAVIVRH